MHSIFPYPYIQPQCSGGAPKKHEKPFPPPFGRSTGLRPKSPPTLERIANRLG